MSEFPSASPEVIDLAWQAAHAANTAHDRMREAAMRLATLRRVTNLVTGAPIDEKVYTLIEADQTNARTDFDMLTSMAAPVMLLPHSPFGSLHLDRSPMLSVGPSGPNVPKSIEEIIDFGSPLCSHRELTEFARAKGYDVSMVSRMYKTLASAAKSITVDRFADYETREDDAPPDNIVQVVRLQTYPGHTGSRYDVTRLVKTSLRDNVRRWTVHHPPDRIGIAARGVSFWADYCNHALPNEEPLPVAHPPENTKEQALAELTPEQLLFDHIVVGGEAMEIVSNQSLLRYAYSIGYSSRRAPHFTKLFDQIAAELAPDSEPPDETSCKITDELIYLGSHRNQGAQKDTRDWGMPLDNFRQFIARLEQEQTLKERIGLYTKLSREVIRRYLDTVTALRT